MSVWILHVKLTPQEEIDISARAVLPLPFGDVPDLSRVTSEEHCKHLFAALHPDDPPESIQRKVDRLWRLYSNVQLEDIIAVPLLRAKELALAEVSGPYRYEVGNGGSDIHTIPVKWHEKRVPFSALRKWPQLLIPGVHPMLEVEEKDARTAIRDRLPHSYNRFAGLKWILGIFLAMQLVMMLMRLVERN